MKFVECLMRAANWQCLLGAAAAPCVDGSGRQLSRAALKLMCFPLLDHILAGVICRAYVVQIRRPCLDLTGYAATSLCTGLCSCPFSHDLRTEIAAGAWLGDQHPWPAGKACWDRNLKLLWHPNPNPNRTPPCTPHPMLPAPCCHIAFAAHGLSIDGRVGYRSIWVTSSCCQAAASWCCVPRRTCGCRCGSGTRC